MLILMNLKNVSNKAYTDENVFLTENEQIVNIE